MTQKTFILNLLEQGKHISKSLDLSIPELEKELFIKNLSIQINIELENSTLNKHAQGVFSFTASCIQSCAITGDDLKANYEGQRPIEIDYCTPTVDLTKNSDENAWDLDNEEADNFLCLEDDVLDLKALAYEEFCLFFDPYKRLHEDLSFQSDTGLSNTTEEDLSPFAVLKKNFKA